MVDRVMVAEVAVDAGTEEASAARDRQMPDVELDYRDSLEKTGPELAASTMVSAASSPLMVSVKWVAPGGGTTLTASW
jgi:hypothetical protein